MSNETTTNVPTQVLGTDQLHWMEQIATYSVDAEDTKLTINHDRPPKVIDIKSGDGTIEQFNYTETMSVLGDGVFGYVYDNQDGTKILIIFNNML